MEDYKSEYEAALARAKAVYLTDDDKKGAMETVFPELMELDKDDEIRQALIKYFTLWGKSTPSTMGFRNEDIVDWLKRVKSVRVKSAKVTTGKLAEMIAERNDKVKPKFKVGDWIITKDKNVHKDYSVCKIVEIENKRYHLENGDYLDKDTLEQYGYRLWTIQDAKDGDVLASSKSIFIFKGIYMAGKPESYCAIMDGYFFSCPEGCWTNEQCYPATKEQCVLLFQKMHEAGFEWDAEKKELKLLISNGGDVEPELSHQEVTKKCEQDKPTNWTEEDEKVRKQLLDFVHRNALASYSDRDKWVAWLEKQGEQNFVDKAEPKFKVGDKVLWKYNKSDVRTITKISDYGTYWIECPGCGSGWWTDDELEPYVESDWTEEDEKKFTDYSNNVLDLWKKEYAEEFINWIGTLKQRLS